MEEEKRRRYITSMERIGMQVGMEKGMQQGMQQGQARMVLRVLGRRFISVPANLAALVRSVSSERLPGLMDAAPTAITLAAVAAVAEALAHESTVPGNGGA